MALQYADLKFTQDTAKAASCWRTGFKKGSDGVYADKNGKRLAFTLNVVSGYTDWITDCQLMERELQSAGIKVNINTMDFDAYNNALLLEPTICHVVDEPWPTPYYIYDAMLRSSNSAPSASRQLEL